MPDWFTQSAGRDIKPRCHVPDVDLDHHEAMRRRKSEMKKKQGVAITTCIQVLYARHPCAADMHEFNSHDVDALGHLLELTLKGLVLPLPLLAPEPRRPRHGLLAPSLRATNQPQHIQPGQNE